MLNWQGKFKVLIPVINKTRLVQVLMFISPSSLISTKRTICKKKIKSSFMVTIRYTTVYISHACIGVGDSE